ncbi:MAG: flavin reductase family protein [Candidatus Omnitrophota bacterium]|nr:flavin reductase family protein [Candidatus Omnitrophota bacterium]
MKIKVNNDKASRLINCGQVILVSCAYQTKTNIVTCAWHMPLSRKPPLLGIALAKTHFSSELIGKSKEFVINIPDWALLNKVMFCGSVSGRSSDKFKEAKLISQKANVLKQAVKVKECIGSIECSLLETKEVGDHFLFIGEAVYAEAEDSYFINDFWDTSKVGLILHLGANFFFKSSSHSEVKK